MLPGQPAFAPRENELELQPEQRADNETQNRNPYAVDKLPIEQICI